MMLSVSGSVAAFENREARFHDFYLSLASVLGIVMEAILLRLPGSGLLL